MDSFYIIWGVSIEILTFNLLQPPWNDRENSNSSFSETQIWKIPNRLRENCEKLQYLTNLPHKLITKITKYFIRNLRHWTKLELYIIYKYGEGESHESRWMIDGHYSQRETTMIWIKLNHIIRIHILWET